MTKPIVAVAEPKASSHTHAEWGSRHDLHRGSRGRTDGARGARRFAHADGHHPLGKRPSTARDDQGFVPLAA